MAAAIGYAQAHLRDGTIAGASNAARVSERTLRRRFAATVGMGWESYQRRARLPAAAQMLTDSDRPLGLIAADVGFESQSAFARAFRLMTGVTPRQFRCQTRI